jgi:cysteine desulfuration protein SufE
MSISFHQQQLIDLFNNHQGWEDRYRLIMRLGKHHPALSNELRIDSVLLSGCESKVWFYGHYDPESQLLQLAIDSDAKIIKGLISIIIRAYQDLPPEQVSAFDCSDFFEQLGLFSHLSPSRANGIRAIIHAIQAIK